MPQPRTALIGVPLVMVEDVIYALPVRYPYGVFVQPAAATIEVSDENDPLTFEPITVEADGSCFAVAAFIRCTSAGGCTLMCKVT